MQKLHILALAVAALLLLPGIAPAAADDAEIIATCVQTESDAGRTPLSCVGRLSDPCLESDAGQSTVGMVECTDRETKVWDAMLNDEYGRLMALLKGKAADDVRNAQRIWITSRDADCRVPYYFYDGGTIVKILGARCELDRTAERALLIRSWRQMAQGEDAAQ